MPALQAAFPGRAWRSILRDLVEVGYRSSCNLHGRFYTLNEIPRFDEDGLWRHGQILFSREGTLGATVRNLVEGADNGRTQREIQQRLGPRVHDTLFDLVQKGEIAREAIERLFVYVSADLRVGATQLARRRAQMTPAQTPLEASTVVAVLLTVIRGDARRPEDVLTHLRAEGSAITLEQIRAVFARYDLGNKDS